MATGTNWKRPWEEEHDGGTGYRSSTSHAVEQSSHSALRTTPLSEERDQPAPQSKELRFVPTSNGTTIFSPSPSRRVDFLPRDNAGAQSPGRPEYSPYLPNKRQRTNCPRRGHNYYPRGGASRSVHGVHNVQEEGLRSASGSSGPHSAVGSFSDDLSTKDEHQADTNTELQPIDDRGILEPINTPSPNMRCETCINVQDVVQRVARSADRLHEQLVQVLTSDLLGRRKTMDVEPILDKSPRDAPQRGITPMLKWGLDKIEESVVVAHEILLSCNYVSQNSKPGIPGGNRASDPSTFIEKARGKWELESRRGSQILRTSCSPRDDGPHHPPELSGCALLHMEEQKKSFLRDLHPQHPSFSSHGIYTPSGPGSLQPHSPMHAPPPHRLLPSPSSMNFSPASQILPPMSPSLLGPKSPHTAHLQELQHQLSTKSLAHQILQAEHDKLLAAFSRSQSRCATLDRKSQVSDAEINNLAEDRLRLQAQLDANDLQIEDLQHSRDDALKQSVACSAQYLQIMAMSSKLQAQAAEDLKKWKADRALWEAEKSALVSRIRSLEIGRDAPGSRDHDAPSTDDASATSLLPARPDRASHGDEPAASSSVAALQAEVALLRKIRDDAEAELRAWRDDGTQVEAVLEKLGSVGERMRKRCKVDGGGE